MQRRKRWPERLLAGTRGRIVGLLRRKERTVNELADELGLTDNAVRGHLAALERDGLVEQLAPLRQGVGKPAHVYGATSAADELLPKGYAPVLGVLLEVLAARMSDEELDEVLRETGRRAAPRVTGGDTRARLEKALAVLGSLGGEGEVRGLEIVGHSCPLAALVPGHPEVCALAEAMVSAMAGVPVRELCEKGDRPRCRFRVIEEGNEKSPLLSVADGE